MTASWSLEFNEVTSIIQINFFIKLSIVLVKIGRYLNILAFARGKLIVMVGKSYFFFSPLSFCSH